MFQDKIRKKEGLNIIIVGCGKVGITLIRELSKEGHDITIIDRNPQKIQTLSNLYDIMGVVGNGASYSIQMEANIKTADLIISVTDSDELNILCCTIAKQVGNCAAIARVRNPDYSKEVEYLREKLGLTMIINPELETAIEAARVLYLPTALEVNSFAHGQAEMTKFKIQAGNPLDGMTIASLGGYLAARGKKSVSILICAIEREGRVHIPSGDFCMERGDIVSFVASRKTAKTFMESIGFKTARVKNTIIVGGGAVAYYLAKQLLHMGISVKIIESSNARCEELSILLPKAVIINGDGTNEEVLKEEGLAYADSFVPLTGIDEENILLTLHAQQVSKAKIITKLDRSNFKNVINTLGLDSVVYPSNITAEAIIAYVRAKKDSMSSNIETLYHMFDYRAEAIEFRVDEATKATDIPLMDLKLKRDVLVAFVNRNGKIIMPSGRDSIQVGDTAMIVTTHTGFKELDDILA